MIEFQGFPSRMQFTPVPNLVFSSLLPQITDINELKLLLHIFEILYPKKGRLKYVTLPELLSHAGILTDFKDSPAAAPEGMQKILAALVAKNVFLRLPVIQAGETLDLFFLNNEANRLNIQKIQNGEIVLPDLKPQRSVSISFV